MPPTSYGIKPPGDNSRASWNEEGDDGSVSVRHHEWAGAGVPSRWYVIRHSWSAFGACCGGDQDGLLHPQTACSSHDQPIHAKDRRDYEDEGYEQGGILDRPATNYDDAEHGRLVAN